MRNLTIIFACASFMANAQQSPIPETTLPEYKEPTKPLATVFQGGLQSTYCFNGGIMTGVALGTRTSITRKLAVQANTVLSLLKVADRSRFHNEQTFGTRDARLYTWFNYSNADLLWTVRNSEMRVAAKSGGKIIHRSSHIKAGYMHYQQTLWNNMGSPEFFQTDTTNYGGGIYVKGFHSEIVSAGLQQVSSRETRKGTLRTVLYADALYGFKRKLPTIVAREDGSFGNYTDNSYFPGYEEKWGWRAGISCEYYGKGHWGAYWKAEFAKIPIPKYYATSRYYVPRGGEGIQPYIVSIQLGAVYRLQLQ